nr:hypothetical protein [Tanacetum cinerariifolium]
GNLEEAIAIRKAIALLRQAIGSSPRDNTRTSKPESTRDHDCVLAEDGLHLHGVRVVQDMHEADQNYDITSSLRRGALQIINLEPPQIQETKTLFKMEGSLCNKFRGDNGKAWYKDKAMLVEAQEAGQILDEEQLAFLAYPRVPDGQAVQTIIPNNAAFQTNDLDTYDSDYNDVLNEKAVLMSNISNYSSDVISEVPHSETYLNDMENQSVRAMQDFKQTHVVDFTDNEIHNNSNIISYS